MFMLTEIISQVTCLDPRCVPEQFFPDGGFAAVRNAGGRATKDAINSITVLSVLAGVGLILVVHHTGNSMKAPETWFYYLLIIQL